MRYHRFFASCPKGLEGLLLSELASLGCADGRETVAGVYFNGDLADAYKVCLWSRLANRVLLLLAVIPLDSERALYDGVQSLRWEDYLPPTGTLKVDFIGTNSRIRHSQFGALRVKDAVVDRFRSRFHRRPSVAKERPDLLIHARLAKAEPKDKLHISLDLAGDSLHRRGYRRRQGAAPLKENLAAALLLRCQWPSIAARGGACIDPLCGAATLLIEAAMIAADIAPGSGRRDFGFTRWRHYQSDCWANLQAEAQRRRVAGIERLRQWMTRGMIFVGYDQQASVLGAAEDNIEAAGLEEFIRVYRKSAASLKCPSHRPVTSGLIICNPPYGERLSDRQSLRPLYRQLGDALKSEFLGWRVGVFTADDVLGNNIGMHTQKKYRFWNGRIPTQLFYFTVDTQYFTAPKVLPGAPHAAPEQQISPRQAAEPQPNNDDIPLSSGAQMVANRLRKNYKKLRRWIRRQQIQCYRLYDADMPEYAAAIDLYGDYIHVQEYAPPKSVDPIKAEQRLQELLAAVAAVFSCPNERIFLKRRRRHRGPQQYLPLHADCTSQSEPKSKSKPTFRSTLKSKIVVREGRALFFVDLWSYLDTGLFLDHRPLRALIADKAAGKRLLNLFCYTASATVQAALAGAKASLSIDMSNTYIQWARENFAANGIDGKRHQLVREDCLKWLRQFPLNKPLQGFDIILLDPPSFSNSKRMQGVFDVQRDHVAVIDHCMRILNPGGQLIFSTNLRSFQLQASQLTRYHIAEMGAATIDPDFHRNPKIHACWQLSL